MSVLYASIGNVPRLGSGVAFVARNAELEQLTAALRRAHGGTAGAVLISGDAGVGKSRLLAEFTERAGADGALILLGRCLGVGDAGLPYLPFTEMLDQFGAANPTLLAEWPGLARLTSPTGREPQQPAEHDGDHSLSQLRLFDAILGLLTDLSAERTVVLAIEDLHWADPSTRDLLSFVLSRLSGQRLLVLATYRADDLHRQHPLRPLLAELVRLSVVDRLDLQPFGTQDARTFVRALADDSVTDDVIASVAERSEGNAFFAEELLVAAATRTDGIPTALADVLLSRVEQLSPATQRVVRAVSVTGWRHVRHATLAEVLGMADDELEVAMREAIQHHILVPSGSYADAYAFRHALMREAVYADLLPGERVRLHTAYAQLAAKQSDPRSAEYLAFHSLHSNDLPTALAASVQAAGYARKVGALAAELRHVEQALELWEAVDDPQARSGVDELTLHRKAAYLASAAGHPERGLAFARAAVRLADADGGSVIRADVRRQLAETLLANSKYEEAIATIDEAWELIEPEGPSRERAWVLAVLARLAQGADADTARSYGEAAIADGRNAGSADAQADALITLAWGDLRDGRPQDACSLLERAGVKAAEAGAYEVELRAKFNLCVNRYDLGELELAAETADEGVARATELHLTWSPYGRQLRWMQVMAHYALGNWERAAEAATPPGEHVSDTISALIAASGGLVQAGRGQFAEAERMLAQVRPEWSRDEQIAQLAGVAGAEIACWQGNHTAAMQVIDEALDTVRKQSGDQWPLGGIRMATLALCAAADLATQARQRHDERAVDEAVGKGLRYAEFAESTAAHGIPRTATLGPEGRAWLARMRAERSRLLGENDPKPWRDVVEAFGYGEIYPQALARWRLAEVLIARSERDAATAEIATALETTDRLGAKPLAESCRALASRARLGIPGAASPAIDTLTPREASVLRLVAAGRTNRQIGEELFISDKTVSVHVSRVMAKLDAASRTEAVSIAYQRGLITD